MFWKEEERLLWVLDEEWLVYSTNNYIYSSPSIHLHYERCKVMLISQIKAALLQAILA